MQTRKRMLIAAAGAAVMLALSAPANAADATFNSNGDTWTAEGTIADPHAETSCVPHGETPLPVVEAACPTYTLVIDAEEPLRYLDVELVFDGAAVAGRTAEDYDLHLYDASGEEVGSAAHAFGSKERLAVNHLPDGIYTLEVVPFVNAPGSSFSLSALFRTASD